ncbi:MAG: transcription elongation factor GreA [Candidatus Omnitrophica bacterium]|nr:transcription elongation factor GreA [Candidatus Omnitrophota bacterium]MCM8831601.1 transcription elongation factor GreA [Candidatus Omnitrophota bacterium]
MEPIYLTKSGYEKLVEELEYLKNVKRKEIAKALEHARQLGDLRENAEYESAKQALELNEKRISELEDKLSRAQIIDEKSSSDVVCLGVKVKLLDLDTNEEFEYKLVGQEEAVPEEGLISISSPVGRALLGHKEADIVTIETPGGSLKYKIIKISY